MRHKCEKTMVLAMVAFAVAVLSLAIDVYQLVVAIRG